MCRDDFRLLPLAAVLLLVGSVPASADWLQTRDGSRLETRGTWQVRGTAVVFTTPRGVLQSIRLADVDLEASARLTAEPPPAEAAPAPPDNVVREPVLTLTNKDIPQASPPVPDGDEALEIEEVPADEVEAAASGRAPATTSLEIVRWRTVDNPAIDGIEVVGTLMNKGKQIVMDVNMVTRLFDEDHQLLGTAGAFLGAQSLAPKTSTTFRALFPKVYKLDGEPAFEILGTPVELTELTLSD